MAKSQLKNNFWSGLNKPIYALAPMAGVADSAFRRMCKAYGADVVYSEMVSATAIVYGSKKTLELARFTKEERPFVVQLFGGKPEHFAAAARIVEKKIKPDGLDINFGCPVKKVARQGAGAALMDDLKMARAVIEAVIDNTKLPVSIKIRASAGKVDAIRFLRAMKDLDIKAVMIHGRSLKQGHAGEVDWKIIKQARKYFSGVILANGGVKDRLSAGKLLELTLADGVGIGQGAWGRPWIFSQLKTHNSQLIIKKLVFQTALRHAKLAEKLKGKTGIVEMRKHLCWYMSGMKNASELRRELVKVKKFGEIKEILRF